MTTESGIPGALALVGSGEYTDAMQDTDRHLLATLGGPDAARVALLPTASGLEADGPRHWNDLGQRHFAQLGVRDIRSSWILDAKSAADPEQVRLLDEINFAYFSGGSPNHLVASMRGSPAWDAVTRAYLRGGVLAGCSAGAMALGGATLSVRTLLSGGRADWVEALGIVPHLVVFPHFDRFLGMMSKSALRTHLLALPPGMIAVGIDEDTALVRLAPPDAATGRARWRVMGRQGVALFRRDAEMEQLATGDEVSL